MILAQTGLIGFALMLWLFITLFRLKIEDKELKELSILMLTVFAVSCIAEPLWILQFPIILFVLISTLSITASKKSMQG
jgi:O-antigen ligase